MVDTRLPEHWSRKIELLELSDSAWRLMTNAFMWSNSQGTDGNFPAKALALCHPKWKLFVSELVDLGLWEETYSGYRVVGDWESHWGQSSAAYVLRRRELSRVRQQKKRDQLKDEPVTRDVPRDVGEERLGKERKARRGKAPENCEGCKEGNLELSQLHGGLWVCIGCESRHQPL